MIQSFSELWDVLFSTGIILVILLFIFRRHIVHIFDPLLFYIITQAFSIELAFLIVKDPLYLINFLGCQIFFLCGFFCFAGKGLEKADLLNSRFFQNTNLFQISLIKWYAIFATFFLVVGNLILIKANGFTLFAEDPSAAKVTNFTGGFGIVKRMNWGMLYLTGLCLLIVSIFKRDIKYAALILLLVLILAQGGSKGALLYFIFLIALLNCFTDIKLNPLFKKARIGSIFLLVFAIFIAGLILSTGSSGDTHDMLFRLATRFLFYGDSMIYYFDHYSVQHFSNYNFIDFLKDEFNSVLAFLRLSPYKEALGYRLINYYYNINSEIFGPSVPYYVKGNIYFGYYGAFVYSFVIGAITGFVRNRFYTIVRKGSPSLLYSILILHLNLFIYTLAQDSPVFISVLFDTFLLSLPVLIIVLYLHFSPKKESGYPA